MLNSALFWTGCNFSLNWHLPNHSGQSVACSCHCTGTCNSCRVYRIISGR